MKTIRISLLLMAVFLFSIPAQSFAETITSKFIKEPIPLNPLDETWERLTSVPVMMEAQRSVRPGIENPSTRFIRVSSLNNGSEIGFRIEWYDPSRDDVVNMPDRFTDAIALQFPMKKAPLPSYMMGEEGKPVHIIHWKAAWDRDIAEGYQDVEHAYPGYNVDIYPLVETAEGKALYKITAIPEKAKVFMAGISARNPLSEIARETPVEELNAEGYRTLTTQSHNDALARGIWEGGFWRVVIVRKLDSKDPQDAPLSKGDNFFSIAVWDGSSSNTGGRKSYSATGWLSLRIE